MMKRTQNRGARDIALTTLSIATFLLVLSGFAVKEGCTQEEVDRKAANALKQLGTQEIHGLPELVEWLTQRTVYIVAFSMPEPPMSATMELRSPKANTEVAPVKIESVRDELHYPIGETSGNISRGTGFIVNATGIFLTAGHVIYEHPDKKIPYSIIMARYNKKYYPVEVIPSNMVIPTFKGPIEYDVAICQMQLGDHQATKYLKLGNSMDCAIGDRVVVMGYPLPGDLLPIEVFKDETIDPFIYLPRICQLVGLSLDGKACERFMLLDML